MSLKSVIPVTALLVLFLLFAFTVWPTPYRYFDNGVFINGDGHHVREHRLTGRLSYLDFTGWTDLNDDRPAALVVQDRAAPQVQERTAPLGEALDAQFVGSDPGAGPGDPTPDSLRVAAEFDESVGTLGTVYVIDFEDLPVGPFDALEVAPGVSVSQTGSTTEGGIVNGCFMNCASDVRRGYNITPGGDQYLGFALNWEVGTASIDFSFDNPVQAFGAHVIGLGTAAGDLAIEFDDGEPRFVSLTGNAQGGSQFVGFTAPGPPINRVSLKLRNVFGGSRDNFSIDDVRYVPAN